MHGLFLFAPESIGIFGMFDMLWLSLVFNVRESKMKSKTYLVIEQLINERCIGFCVLAHKLAAAATTVQPCSMRVSKREKRQ